MFIICIYVYRYQLYNYSRLIDSTEIGRHTGRLHCSNMREESRPQLYQPRPFLCPCVTVDVGKSRASANFDFMPFLYNFLRATHG